jgi:hypothetical protein
MKNISHELSSAVRFILFEDVRVLYMAACFLFIGPIKLHTSVSCLMGKLHFSDVVDENKSVLLTHYCPGDKIEKNEMGGACSSDEGGGDACTGFWWGT